MNYIPLPDELIRKVYGYILPIFDYIKYINLLTEHKKEEESNTFSQLLNRWYPPTNIETIDAKINYYECVKEYAFMMNMRLLNIQEFINDNPLFKRYAKGRVFEGVATTVKEQENHVSKMEQFISRQRGKTYDLVEGNNFKHIIIYHDLVVILTHNVDCLECIIQHCRMNNISVISGPYSHLQRKAAGWSTRKEYRDYLVRKLIAL